MGFARALGLLSASALPRIAPAKCQGAGGSGRSRAPQNRSGWEAEAGGSPPAPIAPRNIYLYQMERLHQEKRQLGPGQGHFRLDGACGKGGAQTPGGPCHCVGGLARVTALYYMGGYNGLLSKPGQSCPHGDTMEHDAPSSTSALPSPGCRHLWVLKAREGHLKPRGGGISGGAAVRDRPHG